MMMAGCDLAAATTTLSLRPLRSWCCCCCTIITITPSVYPLLHLNIFHYSVHLILPVHISRPTHRTSQCRHGTGWTETVGGKPHCREVPRGREEPHTFTLRGRLKLCSKVRVLSNTLWGAGRRNRAAQPPSWCCGVKPRLVAQSQLLRWCHAAAYRHLTPCGSLPHRTSLHTPISFKRYHNVVVLRW